MPAANVAMLNADGSAKVNAAGEWVVTDDAGMGGGCGEPTCNGCACCSGPNTLCSVDGSTAQQGNVPYSLTINYSAFFQSNTGTTTIAVNGAIQILGGCVFAVGSVTGTATETFTNGSPTVVTPSSMQAAWSGETSANTGPEAAVLVGPRRASILVGGNNPVIRVTVDSGGHAAWRVTFGGVSHTNVGSFPPNASGYSGSASNFGQCAQSVSFVATLDDGTVTGTATGTVTFVGPKRCPGVADAADSGCADCDHDDLVPA